MIKINLHTTLILFIVSVSFLSCRKDKEPEPQPQAKTTYSFDNVKYSGQTTRILLLDSLGKLINAASSRRVNKEELVSLYENTNGLFTTATSNYPNLKGKIPTGETALNDQILAWFDSVAINSPMPLENRPKEGWFITPGGLDISQLVQKTLMGAVFYHRATSEYLKNIEMQDNSTVVPGEGTKMEHHWDEAFGYYGAPINFADYTLADFELKGRDINGDGIISKPEETYYFHANYSYARDKAATRGNLSGSDNLNFRKNFMDNWIKGREAISNKDYVNRDIAKQNIMTLWEKQIALTTIYYLRNVKDNFSPTDIQKEYSKAHSWAEGRGFLNSLQYNSDKKILSGTWEEVSNLVGNNPAETDVAKLTSGIQILKDTFGFSDAQVEKY